MEIKANILIEENLNYLEAISSLMSIYTKKPKHYLTIARCYYKLKDYEKSIYNLNKLSLQNSESCYLRAKSYIKVE